MIDDRCELHVIVRGTVSDLKHDFREGMKDGLRNIFFFFGINIINLIQSLRHSNKKKKYIS